jgi:multidrug efflux pump
VEGITLYLQPIQDLTVEDRVSRTQYQYSLEDPDAKELGTWATRLVEKLQTPHLLRDLASDQQNAGIETRLSIDRNTAVGHA